MGMEIEWKFLVMRLPAVPASGGLAIHQAYLSEGEPVVRVRTKGTRAFLTIKAQAGDGATPGSPARRLEFEYEIPVPDAEQLIALAPWRLLKTRYHLTGGIELDVFEGRLAGLVLAELEVKEAGTAPSPPEGWEWLDVSHDARFTNRQLAEHGMPTDCPNLVVG